MHVPAAVSFVLLGAAVLPAASTATPPGGSELAETTLTIDATATREPISPYVYGQFIEHLGRCIYGGLWAEMLEDRKFFYPVAGEAPAWEMYTPGEPSWEGEGHPYELLVRSPWMILALYRHRFGTVPVEVTGDTAPLDVVAAWAEDQTAPTVAVVNPTDESRRLQLELRGAEPTGQGLRFVLTGSDRWAHNAPGRPREVDVQQTSLTGGPTGSRCLR